MSNYYVKSSTWLLRLKGMGCATVAVVTSFESGWRAWAAAVRAAAALLLALTVCACYSPTLPLPPPDSPESAELCADGTCVTVDGTGALPGAQVFVFNTDLGEGVITTGTWNRRYHAVVPVDFTRFSRNTLEIWQREGIEDSSSIPVYCDRLGCQ
jgi:hypothetical protein